MSEFFLSVAPVAADLVTWGMFFFFSSYQGLCLRGVCQGSGAGDLFGKASR